MTTLTSALKQINFGDYFSAFTPRAFPERVIVTHPPYIYALADLLDEVQQEVVEAYLVVRAALILAPHLGTDTEAWKAQRALYERLSGIKHGATGDRSEYCVGRVEVRLFLNH